LDGPGEKALVEAMNNQYGKIPIALIIVIVIVIGGAGFAFLAFSGVIVVPGITPEPEDTGAVAKVEITPQQQFEDQLRQLINDKAIKETKLSELQERVELKDEKIASLEAEIARLEGLIELTDETAVKNVAAIYEKMGAEEAVKILSKFDPEKTVLILKAMDEKRSAAILEGMDPDIAARITEIMAGFTNPFKKPSPPATPPAGTPSANSPTGQVG
jgi:flagellar motility protein MotE (MotC chaperone)